MLRLAETPLTIDGLSERRRRLLIGCCKPRLPLVDQNSVPQVYNNLIDHTSTLVSLILRPHGHTHSTLARYTDNVNRALYSTCKSQKPKTAKENDENRFGEIMKYFGQLYQLEKWIRWGFNQFGDAVQRENIDRSVGTTILKLHVSKVCWHSPRTIRRTNNEIISWKMNHEFQI